MNDDSNPEKPKNFLEELEQENKEREKGFYKASSCNQTPSNIKLRRSTRVRP
jgi:endonuclease YncB( thermonuclease family)